MQYIVTTSNVHGLVLLTPWLRTYGTAWLTPCCCNLESRTEQTHKTCVAQDICHELHGLLKDARTKFRQWDEVRSVRVRSAFSHLTNNNQRYVKTWNLTWSIYYTTLHALPLAAIDESQPIVTNRGMIVHHSLATQRLSNNKCSSHWCSRLYCSKT